MSDLLRYSLIALCFLYVFYIDEISERVARWEKRGKK